VGNFSTTTDADSSIDPIYVLYRPPGESDERFVITRPFVPRNRPNMISLLVASSDPDSYGEITTLQFPRNLAVLGPQQVDNLINQDVEISQTLSLLRQRGSDVQFGSLVILPIDDALLYVQPIFVTAGGTSTTPTGGIPELKFVAMVLGEDVVMESNFGDALTALFGSDVEQPDDGEPTPGPSPTGGETEPPAEVEDLIAEAAQLYEDAQAALSAGDFEEYGRLIEELGDILSQLEELTGVSLQPGPDGGGSGNGDNEN
jgi:uncharacterized protein